MTIGERIREARAARPITQRALAEAVGVSVQAVSQWENNATVPGYARLNLVANQLNVDLRWLIGEIQERRVLFEVENNSRVNTVPLVPLLDAMRFSPFISNSSYPQKKYQGQATTRRITGQGFAVRNQAADMSPFILKDDVLIFDNAGDLQPGDWVLCFIANADEPEDKILIRQLVSIHEPEGTPFNVIHLRLPGTKVPDMWLGKGGKWMGMVIAPMVELIRAQTAMREIKLCLT